MTSVTFGLQVPAGVILPSMAIGSLYGRAVGIIVQTWQKEHSKAWMFTSCDPDSVCITPGVYAIIGAASALGGVTRMTVSIVVIMFELTGALTYVLPIMIAVMLSKWVGDAFGKKGIYETWINFKEYPFLENKDEPVPDIPVSQIMTRIEDMVVITATGNSITSLGMWMPDVTARQQFLANARSRPPAGNPAVQGLSCCDRHPGSTASGLHFQIRITLCSGSGDACPPLL